MADEGSLQLDDEPKGKKNLVVFGAIGLVVVLGIAGGLWFFLGSSDSAPPTEVEAMIEKSADPFSATEAFYVGMPRPFLFNLSGAGRSRLVEIKVQLMVRGADDGMLIKKHIPLIEDALLTTFSSAEVQKLSSLAGRNEMRQLALLNVQNTLQPITGRKVVEKVLFTGFVMQ